MNRGGAVCARCVTDTSVPGTRIDADGICNYCKMHDRLDRKYEINDRSREAFSRVIESIKAAGRGKDFDCVIGLSGGTDSTFCVYTVKKLGLRPLAVHFDNGWVSELARRNIESVVSRLDVPVRTVSVGWDTLAPQYRACLNASIPEMCLTCEVGIATAMYQTAADEGIRYIVLGHSFRTEGITPLRWHYMDGRYYDSILRRFCDPVIAGKALNGATLTKMIEYTLRRGIRCIQLPLYIEYNPAQIRATLEQELGWQYGGSQHFDCLFKPFQAYVAKMKFGIDYAKIALAALVRTGHISRFEALQSLAHGESPPDQASIAYCLERLGMTETDFRTMLAAKPRSFRDFPTYYSFLSAFRMPLKICAALRLVPETLYEKLFETG